MGLQARRKRRKDDSSFRGQQPRGRGRGRGMGHGSHTSFTVSRTQDTSSPKKPLAAPLPPSIAEQQDKSDLDSSSDDSAPEVVSSKPPPAAEAVLVLAPQLKQELRSQPSPKPIKRPPQLQPKPPLRNPFASRPTLLRSVRSACAYYLLDYELTFSSSYFFPKFGSRYQTCLKRFDFWLTTTFYEE